MATETIARTWRRLTLRISLRGLIVLVLVLGVALGWRGDLSSYKKSGIERYQGHRYLHFAQPKQG